MSFDFDNPPPRLGTDSQKWQKYEGRDILPLWVADMDFKSAPALIDALHRRVDHGIFGYARPAKSTTDAVVAAMAQRYSWQVDPAWITWMPGLVVSLNVLSRAFAAPNEEVLTLAPVYPPFFSAPKNQERKTVAVQWRHAASPFDSAQGPEHGRMGGGPTLGRWEIDWEALEHAVTPAAKVFFLCNPHNPIARVWRRDELTRIGEFCCRHDLVLASDEIHCDLILDPALKHVTTGALAPEIARRTVTLMAPSKTYNTPGFSTSLVIIPDAGLRMKFRRACAGIVAEAPALGFTAAESAYRDCEPWRRELLAYLRGNRDLLTSAWGPPSPGFGAASKGQGAHASSMRDYAGQARGKLIIEAPIEATYLAWINCSALGLDDPVAHFERFGVGLSDGAAFGAPKGKYVRLNFGCSRATLREALQRIGKAVSVL